tara:strand:+ start:413 stop:694 length:282 start_codon:yes stop_codon:yes gene_type:complete
MPTVLFGGWPFHRPKKVISFDLKLLVSVSFPVPLWLVWGLRLITQPLSLNSSTYIMGDKSPKSQQKNKNQKKAKNDASNQKKAQSAASKQGGK